MFVQIGDRRIKISSIQEYNASGKRQVGYYATEEEYKLVLSNLDEILKVKSV